MFAIQVTQEAQDNLLDGYWFYEAQEQGPGHYFLACLQSDIETLSVFAAIHAQAAPDIHRTTSKRFPYSVYYQFDGSTATVLAVMDERQNPDTTARHLAQWQ